MTWEDLKRLSSKDYVCGYCGTDIASNVGFRGKDENGFRTCIYICHRCDSPTFFDGKGHHQVPGFPYGKKVDNVPEQVNSLYNEARECTTVNAFAASVLCCRKLLMNIAVSKGADKGLNFIQYVEYLSDKGFVPPDGKDLVDHIRKKGNEATHEIAIMKRKDTEELITFIEMFLKFIYEFPATIKRKTSDDAA